MSPRQASACARPVDGLLDPVLFKCLADPTRARIFSCLVKCGRPCAVGEIADCCAVDLSVVSRHLQQLARAGLLSATRSGRVVSYEVRYEPLVRTLRALATAVEECAPNTVRRGPGRCCAGRC
ncbi:MAG: ArsR/SmtB family transcription factor [Planctomycetota bacterium]